LIEGGRILETIRRRAVEAVDQLIDAQMVKLWIEAHDRTLLAPATPAHVTNLRQCHAYEFARELRTKRGREVIGGNRVPYAA
jgi:hypothetical protein